MSLVLFSFPTSLTVSLKVEKRIIKTYLSRDTRLEPLLASPPVSAVKRALLFLLV